MPRSSPGSAASRRRARSTAETSARRATTSSSASGSAPTTTAQRQLARHLEAGGYSSTLVDLRGIEGLLHLKSGIAWLGGKTLLVIEALASHPAFRGWDLVRVPPGEDYASNCILVNDAIFFAEGFPLLERALRERGYRLIVLPMSEFQKMDGGLYCLSLRF